MGGVPSAFLFLNQRDLEVLKGKNLEGSLRCSTTVLLISGHQCA